MNTQLPPPPTDPTPPNLEATPPATDPTKPALIGNEPPKPAEPSIDPAQPAEGEKKEPAPPEPITAEAIKMPEGFEVDQPMMTEFLGVMNDQNLSPAERAQALVNLQSKAVQAASERVSELWEAKQTEWQDEVRADKEIGGDKLPGVLDGINKLLNVHGTPELRQVFSETGAGNNLHMVKFMNKLAGLLNEAAPTPATVPGSGPTSLASKIYPNLK